MAAIKEKIREIGILTWCWRLFFGQPRPKKKKRPHCSKEYCDSLVDPRCVARNCTTHCRLWCRGICIQKEIIQNPDVFEDESISTSERVM